ncbi:MAG: PUA domain-containing protein [Desulfurococcaceae archaeon]
MIIRKPTNSELAELREIAGFQFDVKGELLIPDSIYVAISPNTNRIRYILLNNEKYLTLRSRDYRFNLHIPAGRILLQITPPPKLRVYVKKEYIDFVARGGTLFAKHVLTADPDIRPGDEVLVVNEQGELVAVGRSRLSGWEIVQYNRGEAVRIREGVFK